MLVNEKDSREEAVLRTAKAMMAGARTAPKGRGIDRLEIVTVHGDSLRELSERMTAIGQQQKMDFFLRDATNVAQCQAVVLLGTAFIPMGLNCGYCGFPTCAAKEKASKEIPCAFNTGDLGIAIGSAVSIAADNRIDSRVMYSAGRAALDLGWLGGDCKAAYAILLSCSGKSPFFDRVHPKPEQK